MAITSRDQLIAALASTSTRFPIVKNQLTGQTAGGFSSFWRASGFPAQGAIPTAPEILNNQTLGGLNFDNPVGANNHYIGRIHAVASSAGLDVYFHDRLGQMGGLSGIVTTPQAVGLDVSLATENLDDRIGKADFSEVQWWLEWYSTTGSTAVTATVSYTNAAGVSGQIATVSIPASTAGGRALRIFTDNGEAIRSIESVTLSASTGTAGNFGVTASVFLSSITLGLQNAGTVFDYAATGLQKVEKNSCIAILIIPGAASTGTLTSNLRLVTG